MKALVVGSMNCMPTEYAILLRKYCRQVDHYYDAGKYDTLSNPTIRWGSKSREKTNNIGLKKIIFHHYLTYLFPHIFHLGVLRAMNRADLVILSGPSISLARLAKTPGKKIVALSYGSDISMFCNPAWPDMSFSGKTGIRALLNPYLKGLKERFRTLQVAGLRACTHYSYFILGIDPATDSLIDRILEGGHQPIRLPRYSINLDILSKVEYTDRLPHLKNTLKILFPVRFCEDELLGNKGWRVLFHGLKKYESIARGRFTCICFKKGNYSDAVAYAQEVGVEHLIEWHDVVSLDVLMEYYQSADVVIDQLGTHWIAQGLFAMALGKPVIGKVATERQREFFEDSGLLAVSDADSLSEQLSNCESATFRRQVGEKSRAFVPAKAAIDSEFARWGIV
jgi:glycosyltransferase involved in cell wall biosynthesis